MLDQATSYLAELLGQNEFFQGGFVLALIGAVAVWGKQIPGKIWSLTKRLLIVECDVQERDEAFRALVEWLALQPYGKKVKRFSVSVLEGPDGARDVVFSPAPGVHWLWHGRRLIRLSRGREKLTLGNSDAIAGFYESFTLQTFGKSRVSLEQVIKEAIKVRIDRGKDKVSVCVQDGYGGWDELSLLPARELDSVVLPGRVAKQIVEDMTTFLKSEQWYTSLGIPYRRGYLFHGPPGTGKTSLVLAMASELRRSVYVLNLGGLSDDDELMSAFLSAPDGAILLIEDVDVASATRPRSKDDNGKTGKGINLSALLNAIDGVMATDGRLLILTTNYPDRLDPALVRPGRVDVRVKFGEITAAEASPMFKRFFSNGQIDEAEFMAGFKWPLTPAEVQSALMKLHQRGTP